MSSSRTPADLNAEVAQVRDDLHRLLWCVQELTEEYGSLDPERVEVDDLGPAMDGAVALTGTIDRLSEVQRGLRRTDDVLDRALQLGSRLRNRV